MSDYERNNSGATEVLQQDAAAHERLEQLRQLVSRPVESLRLSDLRHTPEYDALVDTIGAAALNVGPGRFELPPSPLSSRRESGLLLPKGGRFFVANGLHGTMVVGESGEHGLTVSLPAGKGSSATYRDPAAPYGRRRAIFAMDASIARPDNEAQVFTYPHLYNDPEDYRGHARAAQRAGGWLIAVMTGRARPVSDAA